ncbi:uncharacterized protein E0L32_011338 [Thyridium curvatum]|uniref:Uncharacterized protein n=1 Tax=Thyridium curvatum TaxID=1093900 RepID=A0A507B705_9PEZI|nr:uncharacterized protein E0L32_011338 [Thyridium curvatum]TPX18945.1 hypothetical protein E0L32_011338 [Thyridium curvatum]
MEYTKVPLASAASFEQEVTQMSDNSQRRLCRQRTEPRTRRHDGGSRFSGAPTEMGVLVLVGFLGALGHLLFYHSMDGRSVSVAPLSQEWTLRIGSVLAFVAKTCWTVAVIVAHAQQVWTALDRKNPSLKTIDAMFSSVSDFTNFRHFAMVRTAKVATVLAIVAWCIPLSTIVTPSTLTVVSAPRTSSHTVEATVPMVGFSNASNFAAMATCTKGLCPLSLNPTNSNSGIQYRYPNAQTVVLSSATCSSGRIQAMVQQYSNSSYRIGFHAPVLSCKKADDTAIASIQAVDKQTVPDDSVFRIKGRPLVSYYAFVPAYTPRNELTALDFTNLPMSYEDLKNATLPKALDIWVKAGQYQEEAYSICSLYNATYDTKFDFVNGVQATEVTTSLQDKIPYTIALGAPNGRMDPWGMEFEYFTYQAIWMSLAQLITGRFFNDPFTDTRVLQTPIIGSREFVPYFEGNFGAARQPFASSKAIVDILEELSQNVTLSFFSSPAHR